MTALSIHLARLAARLQDPDSIRFSEEDLLEATRRAVDAFSRARPRLLVAVCTLTVTSPTQVLETLTDPLQIIRVRHPWQSAASSPIRTDWLLSWEDCLPVLTFANDPLPASGEQVEVLYAARHHMDGLDGAEISTFSASWLDTLLDGAAGYALQQRALALAGSAGARPGECTRLSEESVLALRGFQSELICLAREAPTGPPLPRARLGTGGLIHANPRRRLPHHPRSPPGQCG